MQDKMRAWFGVFVLSCLTMKQDTTKVSYILCAWIAIKEHGPENNQSYSLNTVGHLRYGLEK